jgi:hypothetical protein
MATTIAALKQRSRADKFSVEPAPFVAAIRNGSFESTLSVYGQHKQ